MSDLSIDTLNAALSDRYTIESQIGAGGMATVFLAQDLKHNRKVALKVLKPELAAVVGADRFLAEIEVTANLQHPNILPLFDSGEADSFLYYVMPYVEGETLRERIDRDHQLPVEEAVRMATEIAEALDHAHRQGVVHRDIKPGNILLRDGRPVVADFGIALAVGAAGGARLTETGLSVGTPFYMSPEQATGDSAVGAQTDIYALACVLFEMLVGEPPYPGATAQAVLGKIIAGGQVSAVDHRSSIPPNVDAAIRRSLEKIPADRFATADEFARALKNPAYRYGEMAGATGPGVPAFWRMAAVGAGAVALVMAGLLFTRPAAESGGVVRYELELDLENNFNNAFGNNLAYSPDGSMLAYTGTGGDGNDTPGLWIRDRDNLEPRRVPGSDLAYHASFSPSGSEVAFITSDRVIKVVSLEGRPPIELTRDTTINRAGVSWADDGYLYFSRRSLPYGISRVPAGGGEPEILTTVDESRDEVRHYFPDVLPGSEHMLLTIAREDNYTASTRDVAVADIATGEVTVLLQAIQGQWSSSGHIIAVMTDGDLVAFSYDPDSGELGPPVPVLAGVGIDNLVSADVAISRNGSLAYAPGSAESQAPAQPFWVGRAGQATPVDPNWTGNMLTPRISPDGRRVATAERGNSNQLWIEVKELDDGPIQGITAPSVGEVSDRPVWAPGGQEVAFIRERDGSRTALRRRADAANAEEAVGAMIDPESVQQLEFSSDGDWIVYREAGDIFLVSTEGGSEPQPLLTDPTYGEANFALSPDGRWIAYNSNETGEWRVYVRPFPNVTDSRTTVSLVPAISPRWSRDGSELFYRNIEQYMMAAALEFQDDRVVVTGREQLFADEAFFSSTTHAEYDVHPDGRFLMIRGTAAENAPVIVIENFLEELESRTGN